jgi:hypothetical protein
MHAGLSFSYPSISLLLRQPLSIKKSYAGAIQLFMYLCSWSLLKEYAIAHNAQPIVIICE